MKYTRIILSLCTAALFVVLLGSCEDLAVENTNEPDRERALSSPEDIETLIKATFRTFYYAGESYEPSFALSVAADELSSSWGNFGMQDAGSEPRVPYNNDPSYGYAAVAETPFSNAYAAISAALDGIDVIVNEGITIGDEAQTQRAIAFAQFVIGIAHAHVAVLYDQGFVVDKVPASSFDADNLPFEITSYQDVFNAGLEFIQKAITTAEAAPDFIIPSGWMGVGEFTKAEFIGLIKTYRAHYRASVARTPEERASVDWQAVIQDIDDGYTEMNGGQIFKIEDTPQENWFSGFRYYGKNATWTRGDYKTLGPAATGNNYQEWLDSPLNERFPFEITTNDRRITGAGGPQTDGKYFVYSGAPSFPQSRGIYHYSFYTYNRNIATYDNYGEANSKWVFTPATLRLLKAEALLHLNAQGNKAQVVSIINESRVGIGELTPASVSDPIGSINDPQSALDNASIWSKLKHEKRMESFATVCGLAFFDKRGWGDLVDGTFEDLPIPGNELLILQKPIYTSDVVSGGTE